LEHADGRSAWARRFRDLVHSYVNDLSGEDTLSEGQKALARRAALLQVELEFQEAKLARMHEDGQSPAAARIESYGRNANTLRRLIESLELHRGRKTRDVTPNRDATGQIINAIRAGFTKHTPATDTFGNTP